MTDMFKRIKTQAINVHRVNRCRIYVDIWNLFEICSNWMFTVNLFLIFYWFYFVTIFSLFLVCRLYIFTHTSCVLSPLGSLLSHFCPCHNSLQQRTVINKIQQRCVILTIHFSQLCPLFTNWHTTLLLRAHTPTTWLRPESCSACSQVSPAVRGNVPQPLAPLACGPP